MKNLPVFIVMLGLPLSCVSAGEPQKPVAPGNPLIEHLNIVRAQSAIKVDVTYLGITGSEISSAMSSQLKLPEGLGLLITHVAPDSPAYKAGLLKHDVLHMLDDQLLVNFQQFTTLIRLREPGDTATFFLIRGGEIMNIDATLGQHQVPEHTRQPKHNPFPWIGKPSGHPFNDLQLIQPYPKPDIIHGQVLELVPNPPALPNDFTAHAKERYKLRIIDGDYTIIIHKLSEDEPKVTVKDADDNVLHDGTWDPATDPQATGLPDEVVSHIHSVLNASDLGQPLRITVDQLQITAPPKAPNPAAP